MVSPFPPQPPPMPGMMPPQPGMPGPGMMGPLAQTGAGGMPPMGGATPGIPPALPQQTDPIELLAALRQLAGSNGASPAAYRPGYRRPKAPSYDAVKRQADLLYNQNQLWRNMVLTTQMWIRQELCGVFPEDREARKQGFQEEYVSSALSDERNLVVAKLASLKPVVRKLYLDETKKRKCQMVEDAAVWLRNEEECRHAYRGNRPLALDEAAILTDYGMLACRHTLNPYDPDYPLCVNLIDPVSVYPVWGSYGLEAVFRPYRDTASRIAADYGDFAPDIRKKLEDKYGKEGFLDDLVEIPVYEYWDTWQRCVLVDEFPLVPMVAHEYGRVPWTIQYGGLGEPMFTRSPSGMARQRADGEWIVSDLSRHDERVNKAVPLIYYRLKGHETFEAAMARVMTGFKREVNPPFFLKRGMDSEGKPRPEIVGLPGTVNYLAEDEALQPWPNMVGGPSSQLLFQNLGIDRATGSNPLAAYGQIDQSNVSGTAMQEAGDAGADRLQPLVMALQAYQQSKIEGCLDIIRVKGDSAKYRNGVNPLMVPRRRTPAGEAPAFELGQDLLDEVGTRVQVTFSKVNPRDWVNLFNAGKIGVDANFVHPETIAELAGDGDYERTFERLMEYKSTVQLFQHPMFLEMFEMEGVILQQIKENAGDPVVQQWWMDKYQRWEQMLQQKMAQGGVPGQQGQPGQPAGTGGPPAPSVGGPQGVVGPPVPGGNYRNLGQGPGSQGAAVGRPAGRTSEGP